VRNLRSIAPLFISLLFTTLFANEAADPCNSSLNLIKQYPFKGNEKVLDIGCGTGEITQLIANRLPEGAVVGLDQSPAAIAAATTASIAKGKNLAFVRGDAKNLAYQNEFDVVVSFSTLHWVDDHSIVLKGIHSSLKPNGKLLLTLPTGYSKPLAKATSDVIASEKWADQFANFQPAHGFFQPKEYEQLLVSQGFTPKRIQRMYRSMLFANDQAFKSFLKSWFPYSKGVDGAHLDEFLSEVLQKYLEIYPKDSEGNIRFYAYVMEVEAERV
jgi:trans-aconitate 2-methyltransferase